jgi:phage terminase small subunit
LTPKQADFVGEYIKDLNATAAAIRAKYSKKTAQWIGPRLVSKSHVAAAIAAERKKLADRMAVTQERIVREYARLAFRDVRRLVDDAGCLRPITQLDDDDAAAISALEVVTVGNDKVGIGEVTKVKLSDKQAALDSLSRHLGLFNDKVGLELAGKDGQPLVVQIYIPTNGRGGG